MTLNKQLLCVSIILLCLPWAGCQYIHEVDNIFRTSQEQTLMASTKAVASALSKQAYLLQAHSADFLAPIEEQLATDDEKISSLYFHPMTTPPLIDGYSEGWESIPATQYHNPKKSQQSVTMRGAIYARQLFLYFQVTDEDVIYNNPAKSLIDHGDRIVLVSGSSRHYALTTSAPGTITVRYRDPANRLYRESKINAHWQDTAAGYDVEVALPIELTADRLSFYIVDQGIEQDIDNHRKNNTTDSNYYYGPMANTLNLQPPYFIYQSEALQQQLDIFKQAGQRISVVEPHYWLLAQTGTIELPETPATEDTPASNGHWLIRKLYRSLLSSKASSNTPYSEGANFSQRVEAILGFDGHSNSQWYKDPKHSNQDILTLAVPVVAKTDAAMAVAQIGGREQRGEQHGDQQTKALKNDKERIIAVVIAEQSSEQLAALSDSAFNSLLVLSSGAIFSVALTLLGYASWLSWRIKRLSRAATDVLSDDGKLLDNFPSSRAADEIGDLTRNYAQLLQRIGDYTDYLQTLSRKLSHELRTPLAIIHSSLDNLNNQPLDTQSELYQQRAKQGALRLGNILTAMSEASRVEASIENAELETIDILVLLSGVTAAYQDIYPHHRISFRSSISDELNYTIQAVPDLLVQMLDKLIDNAASFCPASGLIEFTLSRHSKYIEITVSNDGPLLPKKMRSQLFNCMVSLREKNDDSSHLGLGLHIVNLIVKYHQGSINAVNRSNASGVIFTITLPV